MPSGPGTSSRLEIYAEGGPGWPGWWFSSSPGRQFGSLFEKNLKTSVGSLERSGSVVKETHITQLIRVLIPAGLLPSCTQHEGVSRVCGYAQLWHGGIVQ